MAANVSDLIKRFKPNDLLKERKHYQTLEKYNNASAQLNLNFKEATPEQRDSIRERIARERRKNLANSIYTLIVSVLVTIIIYYIVAIFFK